MASFNNIDNLKRWFMENGRGETPAPYWTLYVGDYGVNEKIVKLNDRVTDMGESFDMLSRTIIDMNNPVGSRFRVAQGTKPRDNMPVAQTHVQIFATQGNTSSPQSPGIAGVPEGYVSKDEIAKAVADARREWKLEARIAGLESQLATPTDWTERITGFIEKLAETPMGAVIMAKLAGIPLSQMPAPAAVNGTPQGDHAADGAANGDDDDQMYDDLEAVSKTTGLTEPELLKRLRRFTDAQPQMARDLLNQI